MCAETQQTASLIYQTDSTEPKRTEK